MPNKHGEPTESEIQQQIVKYLRLKGWFCFKIHQSLGSYPGIADLYACKDGRSIWIEVKTPRGRQSEKQIQFEAELKEHGVKYYMVRDISQVLKL